MGIIIQANINRCKAAQDILAKIFDDEKILVAIISEPNNVPEVSRWYSSTDNPPTVAITWGLTTTEMPKVRPW